MSRHLRVDQLLSVVLPLVFFACACLFCVFRLSAEPASAQTSRAPSGTAPSQAQALFKAKCAVCHGESGAGDSLVGRRMKLRDLRSPEVQNQTDAQLATILHCGKGNMPGYEARLTDPQIAQLVAYLRTLRANPNSRE